MTKLIDKRVERYLTDLPTGRTKEEVAQRLEAQVELFRFLRDQGLTHAAIAERIGVSIVRTFVLQYNADAEPMEPTPKNVRDARLRDKLSWGQIAANAGVSETAAKKLFTEATGKSHRTDEADIHKGGRYPSTDPKPEPKRKARKKAAPKVDVDLYIKHLSKRYRRTAEDLRSRAGTTDKPEALAAALAADERVLADDRGFRLAD